tara:strand:+ start:2733 stop:2906 length:174 start_codon:yes stop_codon:yes gene_type:complete
MRQLKNSQIIDIANVKLECGWSENRVCDWVFEECNNDKKALKLLGKILNADKVITNL